MPEAEIQIKVTYAQAFNNKLRVKLNDYNG
jgi:hypothetical protein